MNAWMRANDDARANLREMWSELDIWVRYDSLTSSKCSVNNFLEMNILFFYVSCRRNIAIAEKIIIFIINFVINFNVSMGSCIIHI